MRCRSAAAPHEFIQATPLAEDGFLYSRISGACSTDRCTLRRCRPHRLAHGSRKAGGQGAIASAGAAGQFRHHRSREPAADHRDRQGNRKNRLGSPFADTPEVALTSAPLAIKDKIIVGAANGDQGVRDWIAGLDAATGKRLWRKYTIPAPGEPGSETWKGNNNAWQTGGAAVWVTGTYDPESNQTVWGTGNPVPMFDPTYRPGDNLFTNSAISWNPDTGAMNWYFQFTPGDMWDYDEVGTHIMIDGDRGAAAQADHPFGPQRLLLHHGAGERRHGQCQAVHGQVNWTKGIDQKTGKPIDYDPKRTSRPIRRSPTRTRASRPGRCARRSPAATITGRRPTARGPGSPTSRR